MIDYSTIANAAAGLANKWQEGGNVNQMPNYPFSAPEVLANKNLKSVSSNPKKVPIESNSPKRQRGGGLNPEKIQEAIDMLKAGKLNQARDYIRSQGIDKIIDKIRSQNKVSIPQELLPPDNYKDYMPQILPGDRPQRYLKNGGYIHYFQLGGVISNKEGSC